MSSTTAIYLPANSVYLCQIVFDFDIGNLITYPKEYLKSSIRGINIYHINVKKIEKLLFLKNIRISYNNRVYKGTRITQANFNFIPITSMKDLKNCIEVFEAIQQTKFYIENKNITKQEFLEHLEPYIGIVGV